MENESSDKNELIRLIALALALSDDLGLDSTSISLNEALVTLDGIGSAIRIASNR